MSGKPFISARIPEDLQDSLQERVNETGESKTDIVVRALRAYLGAKRQKEPSSRDVAEVNAVIEERLDELESHLSKKIETLQEGVISAFVKPEKLREINDEIKQLEKKGVSLDWKLLMKNQSRQGD